MKAETAFEVRRGEMARRVAIVGAGASGLTAIRQALQYDCEPVAFEASNYIGGLWHYKPYETDESSVMKSTVINTSKEMTAYSDFPPPKEYANFMHNTQLYNYMESYAEHFGLLKYVKFGHKVQNIARADDFESTGQWKLQFTDSEGKAHEEIFDGVLLCSGHHAKPYWPQPWKGQNDFEGRIIHSHSYKDHRGYEDKVVVVIGVGNSGGDVAVELSRIAKQVYLVTRRGTWVFNRIFDYGVPFDLVLNRRYKFLMKEVVPEALSNWFLESKLQQRFDHTRYGLKPEHRVFSAHPTVNDELPNRIACGTVIIKPNIASFTKNGVIFEDGSVTDNVDEVVVSTGYSFEFPLLEGGKLVPVVENQVELFEYMYPPELAAQNTLAIIGLVQPLGSISPISEMQSRVFFDVLTSRSHLPNEKEMKEWIEKKRIEMGKRYVKSRRHTIQVDYLTFMDELASLIGAMPNVKDLLRTDPLLAFSVIFGPNVPYVYRLSGPFPWKGARDAIMGVQNRVVSATQTRIPISDTNIPMLAYVAISLIVLLLYSLLM